MSSDEPSGRELDAWLAEKLFGYRVKKDSWLIGHQRKKGKEPKPIYSDENFYIVDENGEHMSSWWAPGHSQPHTPVPHYSGADWQTLAERMRQKGYALALYWMPDWEYPKDSPRYRAEIDTEDAEISTFLAAADTPGGAVALAAYRALRAEEESKNA